MLDLSVNHSKPSAPVSSTYSFFHMGRLHLYYYIIIGLVFMFSLSKDIYSLTYEHFLYRKKCIYLYFLLQATVATAWLQCSCSSLASEAWQKCGGQKRHDRYVMTKREMLPFCFTFQKSTTCEFGRQAGLCNSVLCVRSEAGQERSVTRLVFQDC